MDDGKHNIKRGLFWLGSANIIARLVDLASIVVVLLFLSREEMGVATVAWSVAVIIEAFNGFGVATAMLQAPEVSDRQLSSLFWYVMGMAGLLVGLVFVLAPWIASLYGAPELVAMIVFSSTKLLFVGAALVPLQMLNRSLDFKQIGVVQTLATFLSAVLKVVLAAMGFGAWALVAAFTAHGFFVMIGAFLFKRYLPELHFSFAEIKGMVLFGVKAAISSILPQIYRNADFLLVGRILGKEALGVYRVAFDVAMTPALAVLQVVNRTAFPVFSRMSDKVKELADTFLWTQRSLAFLVAPVALFLVMTSQDILSLVGKEKWIAAVPGIQILAWAALLRCLAMIMPQLFHARGRPELAIYDSVFTGVLLISSFAAALLLFGERHGALVVCVAWLICYPVVIAFLLWLTRKVITFSIRQYFSSLGHPAAATALALGVCSFLSFFRVKIGLPGWLNMVLTCLLILAVFWAYLRFVMGVEISGIIRPGAGKSRSR